MSNTTIDPAITGQVSPATCEASSGDEEGDDCRPDSNRLPERGGEPSQDDPLHRTLTRLRASRAYVLRLQRQWEQTEAGAPAELRALVRLWSAQVAYVQILREARRLKDAGPDRSRHRRQSSHPSRPTHCQKEA